jgi:hypothetical protein
MIDSKRALVGLEHGLLKIANGLSHPADRTSRRAHGRENSGPAYGVVRRPAPSAPRRVRVSIVMHLKQSVRVRKWA